jgi:tRNA uridine 5-carbamoylmethylation protein Kti12
VDNENIFLLVPSRLEKISKMVYAALSLILTSLQSQHMLKDEKILCLMVDHTNFLKGLRGEVVVQIPTEFEITHAVVNANVEVQV